MPQCALREAGGEDDILAAPWWRNIPVGFRRRVLEALLPLAAPGSSPAAAPPEHPGAIFVLRNNDIGDLLVITPLFEALKRRFPHAAITAGIGDWNRTVLAHNPWVSHIASVNAPWQNKFIGHSNTGALRYIYTSPEVAALRAARFDIGIDVLGSQWGALLMYRAGIPYRMGVRGYAGGHSLASATVPFCADEHVGRTALRFAELLGTTELPDVRPQLFLTEDERRAAEARWSSPAGVRRIVIAASGGLPGKAWPIESHRALVAAITQLPDVTVAALGGPHDRADGAALAAAGARDWTGQLDLRATFACIAQSDFVLTAPSMSMHVAAAFRIPSVVLLGPAFPSAEAHARQWGYPGDWCNLGRDATHTAVWTIDEALGVVLPKLRALASPRGTTP